MSGLIQILAALAGSCGFALLYNHKKWNILFATLGGGLTWGVYLLCALFTEDVFVLNLISSLFAALYSEVMARIRKAPVTAFVMNSIIPLVPGGSLYYAMRYLITEQNDLAVSSGLDALLAAGGIAVGIVIVSVIFKYVTRLAELIGKEGAKNGGK